MALFAVDLNADLGEGFGRYRFGADEELMKVVSSTTVACGFHAGDPLSIRETIEAACRNDTTIGAHPAYPDLVGFGRRHLEMSPRELENAVLYQIGALDGLCRAVGTRIQYVKPHGAMYNDAAKNPKIAEVIVQAVKAFDPQLYLLCPDHSAMAQAAKNANIPYACEFFADRGYQENGMLIPRSKPGAIITQPKVICNRVLQAIREGSVSTASGTTLRLRADSVCVHGDNPEAVSIAQYLRRALADEGIQIRPFIAL